jgi:hypothetical protein
MKRVFFAIIAVLLMFPMLPACLLAKELKSVPAAIQITSTISDGVYSIKDIVAIAKKSGIKVVVITDRDLMKWEYGLKPLENIIKKTSENGSIFRYGIQRYLSDIEKAARDNPDMVIISGTESAPYYQWTGHPLHNNLTIKDWHKHIITIGLDKQSSFENLPIVGNWRGLEKPYNLKSLWLAAWPVLLIIFGLFAVNRRGYEYIDSLGRKYPAPRCMRCVVIGSCLILSGIIFLVNNYPFKEYAIDIYGKAAGVRPYQSYIDYVSKRGALTFWSHPEAQYVGKEGRVYIDTREHTGFMLEAHGYTGFAIFYEGYEKVGLPGGLWDEYLNEYCHGARAKPIWAIGGLSFEGNRDLGLTIKDLRTVLLVPKLGKKEALDAMRSGSMYVARGGRSADFSLKKFSVSDLETGKEATSGGEVSVFNKPAIKISGAFNNGDVKTCTIRIIRDGVLMDSFEEDTPFDISYDGKKLSGSTLSYYRIEILSDGLQLVSNPIFVRHKEKVKRK